MRRPSPACTGWSAAAAREILDGDQFGAVDLAEEQDAGIDGLIDERALAQRASTTVQAPQSPSPQPSFVPVLRSSSLR